EIPEVAEVGCLEPEQFEGPSETEQAQPDKVHNLVIVPASVTKTKSQRTKPQPRRLIVDNDPALNYLDSVPTSVRVEVVKYHQAPAFARFLGAVGDLMVVALLCTPFAALVELTNGNLKDLRVAATGAALFSVMSFLYFTVSIALTGRTFGMRLFSLRIVDARTGLIPTGKQSAGRALVYLGTILTLGLASLYVLIDRDKQTAHDRLTRTTVITV
ncbi:MAG: RDD family protein, partial [Acidobacteriota bacterium]|nr:RDD family protein [Acidobacteriota bacterium]